MSKCEIRFPLLLDGQRQCGSDYNRDAFKGKDFMSNMTRELCQNSTDMRLDMTKPVRVVFELKYLIKKEHEEFFNQFSLYLQRCREYWGDEIDAKHKRFLDTAEDALKKDKIPVLIVSDHNTMGAYRRKTKGKYPLKSPWCALAESEGYNCKPNDNSGGSFGIGKNASYACSDLNTLFYFTLFPVDDGEESAFIGIIKMGTTMTKEGEPTQGTAKYWCVEPDIENGYRYGQPINSNHENKLRDMFKREKGDFGLDVIHLGFNQEKDWDEVITQAILKNFFVAIHDKKLVVEIKNGETHIIIDDANLSQLISKYAELYPEELRETEHYYKTLTEPSVSCKLSIAEKDDVEVFVKLDPEYKRKVVHFRNNGMVIKTLNYNHSTLHHFASVVVATGEKLCLYLRAMEVPKHDDWDAKQIEEKRDNKEFDDIKQEVAEQYLNDMYKQTWNFIKKQFEIVKTDAVDAAGLAELLPNNICGTSNDLMIQNLKIGKVLLTKSKKQLNKVNTTKDKPNEAEKPEGNNGNSSTEESWAKEIPNSEFPLLRAFLTDSATGKCRVIIQPNTTHEKIFLKLCKIGENGKQDKIELTSFKSKESIDSLQIVNGLAGSFALSKNKVTYFDAELNDTGTMKIVAHILKEKKPCQE